LKLNSYIIRREIPFGSSGEFWAMNKKRFDPVDKRGRKLKNFEISLI